jgi:spermidine synthase
VKRWRTNLAVALVSFTTLTYELALMRVFSVTIWYYFAFFVISLALLGAGSAGAVIFVRREWFKERLERLLPRAAALFGLFCALSPLVYLTLNLRIDRSLSYLEAALYLLVPLVLFLIPFLLGGFIIAAVFSYHSERIGSLYWSDLMGAGLGCLAVIPLLYAVPAPVLLACVGVLPVAAAFVLGGDRSRRGWLPWAAAAAVVALGAVGFTSANPYRVRHPKLEVPQERLLHVTWNPLARLSVYEGLFFKGSDVSPFGWGMSRTYPGGTVEQHWIQQDESAGTPITRFDGDLSKLDFLAYDVTNLAYRYRDFDRAMIVGPGGGRDILAAKYFGVDEVCAVEINPAMLEVVDGVFGDFSGRPYELEGVEGVVEEARSFLSRSPKRWDLIQISLIDSWAASMAGAFALAENNLYTLEAFELYLDRLAPDGVLSVSRWYSEELLNETLRLVNLCAAALEESGVADPAGNLVVVEGGTIATVLVSKRPFTPQELERIDEAADELEFNKIWIPDHGSTDAHVERMLTDGDREAYVAGLSVNLSAPTDDRPFFFMMTDSILRPPEEIEEMKLAYNTVPVTSLRVLFYGLLAAAVLFIVLPLALRRRGRFTLGRVLLRHPHNWLYFAAIGLGFMLVELGLIQRYVLFLGHPTYATSVVIFTLLAFAGLGSATTTKLAGRGSLRRTNLVVFALIAAMIAVQAFLVPALFETAIGAVLVWRILLSALLLAPLGYVMGMALPLGVNRLNAANLEGMVPYVWGVNSVFSVLASSLSVVVAVVSGYTTVLLFGLGAYAVAAAAASFPWRGAPKSAETP